MDVDIQPVNYVAMGILALQVVCILVWQFSAFAFLLQVSAAFLCCLLSCRPGASVGDLSGELAASAFSFLFLFFVLGGGGKVASFFLLEPPRTTRKLQPVRAKSSEAGAGVGRAAGRLSPRSFRIERRLTA